MTAVTYETAIAKVFKDEGGYTNDPKDPGGATNWGITINDARMYWKPNATAADVKAMPKSVAEGIYRSKYAAPVCYDLLPAGFDYTVLDAGINSGIGRAIPWAAKSLGLATGTKINQIVVAAGTAPDKVKLIQKYWANRLAFLHSLKTWSHFGGGWGKRVATGEALAVKLWLTFGAAMTPAQVNGKLQTESDKAKVSQKNNAQATVATSIPTGGAAGSSGSWWDHLSMGGKVAIIAGAALAVVAVVYFARKYWIHGHRAEAYAAEAGA